MARYLVYGGPLKTTCRGVGWCVQCGLVVNVVTRLSLCKHVRLP